MPGFVQNAEEESQTAFQNLIKEPVEFHILTKLASNPDMTIEEIRVLENPDLLSDRSSE